MTNQPNQSLVERLKRAALRCDIDSVDVITDAYTRIEGLERQLAAPLSDEKIKATAQRIFEVHPKEIQDAGLTRTGFIEQEIRALLAQRAAPQEAPQEPVAWMWQHDETGRIGFVDVWQVECGKWETGNPRLKLIAPLYRHPAPISTISAKETE